MLWLRLILTAVVDTGKAQRTYYRPAPAVVALFEARLSDDLKRMEH